MHCHPGQNFMVMQGVVLLEYKSGQLHNYHIKKLLCLDKACICPVFVHRACSGFVSPLCLGVQLWNYTHYNIYIIVGAVTAR